MAESIFRGTTICAVRRNGECAMAGDGQVTMGQQTVMKAHAHKVRRIYNGKVVVGFAGSVADAFALSEKGLAYGQGHAQTGGHAFVRRQG